MNIIRQGVDLTGLHNARQLLPGGLAQELEGLTITAGKARFLLRGSGPFPPPPVQEVLALDDDPTTRMEQLFVHREYTITLTDRVNQYEVRANVRPALPLNWLLEYSPSFCDERLAKALGRCQYDELYDCISRFHDAWRLPTDESDQRRLYHPHGPWQWVPPATLYDTANAVLWLPKTQIPELEFLPRTRTPGLSLPEDLMTLLQCNHETPTETVDLEFSYTRP